MDIQTVLFTYNRPYHTHQVLLGMKANKIREFYIYVDAPASKNDYQKQEKLRSLFSSIDWADIEIIYRKKTLGLAKSIVDGVTKTLKKHDAIIVLEDDCFPLEGFYSFMTQALNRFKHSNKVKSICGYTHPCFDHRLIHQQIFFIERFCPWGWATWKDRWQNFNFNLKELITKIKIANRKLSTLGNDIEDYCRDDRFINQKMEIWSLNWILCHLLDESLVAYPKYSLIENIGFDGSGTHSLATDIFKCLPSKGRINNFLDLRIEKNIALQKLIISFLEKNSKMSMIINGNYQKKINENITKYNR